MFLKLNHQGLDLNSVLRKFVSDCYYATKALPPDERFVLTTQIRRAALSAYLNFAEGCSRKSKVERKRFYEISRSSIVEVDAAMDVALDLNYFRKEQIQFLSDSTIKSFSMISKLIQSQSDH